MFPIMHSTKIAYMVLFRWAWAARALDEKSFLKKKTPPEPLVQIQNSFSELFMIPSTKIAQMVQLHQTKGPPDL